MVIHDADSLQVGINYGWTNGFEPSLLEIIRYSIGQFRTRRDLRIRLPGIDQRFTPYKIPYIVYETAKLFLYLQEAPSIMDRSFNLLPVSDDTCVV